jgi:hypothetical protein
MTFLHNYTEDNSLIDPNRGTAFFNSDEYSPKVFCSTACRQDRCFVAVKHIIEAQPSVHVWKIPPRAADLLGCSGSLQSRILGCAMVGILLGREWG